MTDPCPHAEPEPPRAPRALTALPQWVVPAAAVVLAVVALILRGALGAALLGVLAVGLVALTVPAWRHLTLVPRLARGAVLLVLLAGALVMAVPR